MDYSPTVQKQNDRFNQPVTSQPYLPTIKFPASPSPLPLPSDTLLRFPQGYAACIFPNPLSVRFPNWLAEQPASAASKGLTEAGFGANTSTVVIRQHVEATVFEVLSEQFLKTKPIKPVTEAGQHKTVKLVSGGNRRLTA